MFVACYRVRVINSAFFLFVLLELHHSLTDMNLIAFAGLCND